MNFYLILHLKIHNIKSVEEFEHFFYLPTTAKYHIRMSFAISQIGTSITQQTFILIHLKGTQFQ